MHDTLRVQVGQRGSEVARGAGHGRGRQRAVRGEHLKQLAHGQLSDEHNVLGSLKAVQQRNDVGVVQALKDGHLGAQRSQVRGRLLRLGQQLEGAELARVAPAAAVHAAKGSLAQALQQLVGFHFKWRDWAATAPIAAATAAANKNIYVFL